MQTYNDIHVSHDHPWLEIRLERPDKFNALREQTATEMLDAIAQAEADPALSGIILCGSAKAFCSGIDTAEFQIPEGGYFDFYRKRKRSKRFVQLFRELPAVTKPVLCAVEGVALGGGLELALMCDIIIAGRDARFALPETGIGIMPGAGGTQTLPRRVGKSLAKELIWTGRRVDAEQALAMRLIDHLVEPGTALARARALMQEIAARAPLALMQSKAAIERGAALTLADGMAFESDAVFTLYFSQDRDEGLAALRDKRPARFEGR